MAQLGRTDGFFGNPQVKIPLPDSLTRTEKMLRRVGMGRYADELVLTMNRAAEAAVPEARQLLVDSIRKMTIRDAKGILAGGDTAGTAYFRRTTRDPLHGRFLPVVKRATAKVNLARKYNEYAEKGVRIAATREAVFQSAGVILQVRSPGANPETGAADLTRAARDRR